MSVLQVFDDAWLVLCYDFTKLALETILMSFPIRFNFSLKMKLVEIALECLIELEKELMDLTEVGLLFFNF